MAAAYVTIENKGGADRLTGLQRPAIAGADLGPGGRGAAGGEENGGERRF